MCPVIDKPASYEICAVLCFLHARNMSAMEIHHELCAIYGQNVRNEGTVRQWCRMFKVGQTNVHDEQRSGQTICSECALVQSVGIKKTVKDST
jgi:hypothetical protein